jgi:hypothetical protein
MSKEFEKLEALLNVSEPSDCEPQVNRGEAAKLAARWGWLVHRAKPAPVYLVAGHHRTARYGPDADWALELMPPPEVKPKPTASND